MAENKKAKADAQRYEDLQKANGGLNVASLQVDLDRLGADTTKQAVAKNFIKNLKKDIYISEASNIIKDQWSK